MKRFRKVYLEISNRCNLRCSFCPGTRRAPGAMALPQFRLLLEKLRPWTDYLYFHLMGEPLCHPNLGAYLALAGEMGFRVILTTNGTLLSRQQELLLNAPALHKVNISLHAFEANDLAVPFRKYLEDCFAYGRAAAGKKLTVYRLWNEGGADTQNDEILAALREAFPEPWVREPRGTRIGDRVYLEYGEKFDWPDLSAPEGSPHGFCYGLRDQLGVLCDGTVVPCCLDHDGDLALGNLFHQTMDEILESPRAQAIYHGFSNRQMVEPLCRCCGYA
jgi:MoaA/NifB/PqqE/SkfB family radical SAM enzyme